MTIELWDIDVPYALHIDCSDEGKDFIRIAPNIAQEDRTDKYDICLDKEQCKELARCLMFMAKEIK